MNRLEIKENWSKIKNKLKKKYGKLTDDDLQLNEGNEREIVIRLQRKLEKNRREIVEELREMKKL